MDFTDAEKKIILEALQQYTNDRERKESFADWKLRFDARMRELDLMFEVFWGKRKSGRLQLL